MHGSQFFRQVASKAPFSKMPPEVAGFFKDYLANEKVIRFNKQSVLSTHFPPFPSRAFDNLAEQFSRIGASAQDGGRLYSVTLAVTNRCNYHCWHCYNAGRSQAEIPLDTLRKVIGGLQDLGAAIVTLTGGEPLLREDLEEIAGVFDQRTCLKLNTSGAGLTPQRARSLRDSSVWAVGVSLDSLSPEEHDKWRGKKGAHRTALAALHAAGEAGLYPYVVTVANHDLLHPDAFHAFLKFAAESGAREVHLLEPCAIGRLAGRNDVPLGPSDRERILRFQKEIARDDSLPILSTFSYIESCEAFGCGAGLNHLYIDGSGEVCPCNLIPLSFGNVTREPLRDILDRMGTHFRKPRPSCVGALLAKHIPADGPVPAPPEASEAICRKHLPRSHPTPRFFQVKSGARKVGRQELRVAYDRVHGDYDEFWLKEASRPIKDLVGRLSFSGAERVFEAGCGTGFATVMLARKTSSGGRVIAVDLSKGMLAEARRRAQSQRLVNIRFVVGDALQVLNAEGAREPFDLIFSSWVLGYIPVKEFLSAASGAMREGGRLAFVVHRDNSPREPLEIFGELVAEDPSLLTKQVAFDFPRDAGHVRLEVESAGLKVERVWEGAVTFRYATPQEVLEHLLKSGAGTAFHDAVDPAKRRSLEGEFFKRLAGRHGDQPQPHGAGFEVVHEYVSCIALKPTTAN